MQGKHEGRRPSDFSLRLVHMFLFVWEAKMFSDRTKERDVQAQSEKKKRFHRPLTQTAAVHVSTGSNFVSTVFNRVDASYQYVWLKHTVVWMYSRVLGKNATLVTENLYTIKLPRTFWARCFLLLWWGKMLQVIFKSPHYVSRQHRVTYRSFCIYFHNCKAMNGCFSRSKIRSLCWQYLLKRISNKWHSYG